MSYWNPDFSDRDEVLEAHRRGSLVASILAIVLLLSAGVIYFLESVFATPGLIEPSIWSVAGMLIEAALALFVAWRFSVGKGAFTGALLLVLLVTGIVLQVLDGTYQGIVVAAIIGVGLFHAVRAAFTVRASPERFE